MKNETPSYYAIIPANVRYDNTLKANEKLMYGEITCLSQSSGECFASNEYFAKLYGTSKETVSRWISNLSKKGYIKTRIVYKNGTKQIINRYIQINQEGIDKNVNTPIDENVKDNNTSNNNTSNNKPSLCVPKSFNGFKYPEAFENLWKLYNEGTKSTAYKSYIKIAQIKDNAICLQEQYVKPLKAILEAESVKTKYKRHLSTILNLDILAESQKINTTSNSVDNIKLTSGVDASSFDKYNKGNK